MFKKIIPIVALLFCMVIAVTAEAKNPLVLMDTSLGKIKIELFEKEAPISVKNFLDYANSGFYNGHYLSPRHSRIHDPGWRLHRLTAIRSPPTPPIKNEAANGLKNDRGTIAMARTAGPDSATSQFFINVVNNKMLNRPNPDGSGYAVFGKVIEGMDVVDKIVNVKPRM